MVREIEKHYRTIEVFVTALLFVLAVSYDAMHFPRMYTFIGGFLAFACLVLFRKHREDARALKLSYLLSIGCILLLELNSRYIINYFIHVLYILLMIELAVTLKRRSDLWIGGLIILGGMYKYVSLIQYKPSMSTYAEAVFFLMINLMSIFVITLMQGLRDEQVKLLKAKTKLEAYSDEVKALTEIKTRADVASIIHDGVGHNLTALIMQLEMTGHLMDTNPQMAKNHLEAAKETARDNLVQIRKAVKTLDAPESKHDFEQLIRRFSVKTGLKISWEIDTEIPMSAEQKQCIYRSIQEGLTNAVRHGHASQMQVVIQATGSGEKQDIQVVLHDNGNIKDLPQMGYGLSKMAERYEDLGGRVHFKLDQGLRVTAFLPLTTKE